MNAYLFTSLSTITQIRPSKTSYRGTNTVQTWDASANFVIIEQNSDKAQALFEECIHTQAPGENPMQIEVKKISGAQFLDQLLTEQGNKLLDWHRITEQVTSQVTSTPSDSFEQGFWVDVDQTVPPGKLSVSIEELQRDLPQDFGADLNWSAKKQFLFVLSVLTPPLPPALESEGDFTNVARAENELEEKDDSVDWSKLYEIYPQARDKEVAAVIQARNSIVAAWLWRRYAANTELAANQIRIDPLPDVIGLPEDG